MQSAAECHASSSSESKGSVSEPRIPAADASCRNAEDRWRTALAMTHVKASKIVVFAEHSIRKASETSELPGRFIVSSPFDLWRRGGLADPILRERFAKSFRQAAWRPGFLRTPQKQFPPGGEERTAARCQAAPLRSEERRVGKECRYRWSA